MKSRFRSLSSAFASLRGNVFYLGLVSLFTDLSSEMIYPLLPVFLTGLVSSGAVAVYIGLMDGLAESTSSILKIYAGRLSDRMERRKSFVFAGYAISSLARPMLAIASCGWHVILLRLVDRIGKGIRTSPRDVLISDTVSGDIRGLAFSFHRLMDHTGAVGGPLCAMLFLYFVLGHGLLTQHGGRAASPEEMDAMRWLFAVALLPGLVATITLWRKVREIRAGEKIADKGDNRSGKSDAQNLSGNFLIFLASITLFTLGNSSDLFLIYYAQTRFGLGLGWVIALWTILHISKIIFSLPGGRFADRVGYMPAIISGWFIYILVYAAMPHALRLETACVLLIVYGAYYGLTEGAQRAMVAGLVPAGSRGKAYGLYHGAIGLAALPASFLFGVFWAELGPETAFSIGATLAAAALLLLVLYPGLREANSPQAGG